MALFCLLFTAYCLMLTVTDGPEFSAGSRDCTENGVIPLLTARPFLDYFPCP